MLAHDDADAGCPMPTRSQIESQEIAAWCFCAMIAMVAVVGWVELVCFVAGFLK